LLTNVTGGSGSYQYSLNGGSWQASPTFSNLTVGQYTVSIRDAQNGSCTRLLGQFTVNGPLVLNATISLQQITCFNGTGILTFTNPTGGSGQYRYSIDAGATWYTSPSFTVTAGTYQLWLQDLNHLTCTQIINPNYVVSQPSQLNATISVQHVSGCNGASNASITISNATGGSGTYEYSNNGGLTWVSNNVQQNLIAGSYNVQIRDAQNINCVRTLNANVTITQPASITAQYTKTDLICFGAQNGRIQFTNQQGGSGNYEYSIDGGGTWQNNSLFASVSGGIYNLRIREFGNPNCVTVVANTVVVYEPTQLNANVTATPIEGCDLNNNGSLTFSNYQGGSGSYEFSVNNGSWIIGPTVTGLASGNYTVQIRDAQYPTCVRTLGIFTIYPAANLTANVQLTPIVCFGGGGTLTFVNPQGGSGHYRFSIDGGISWFTNNVFSVTNGTYDLRIQDQNYQNCTAVINNAYQVSQPGQLNATINATPITGCFGNQNGSISFDAPVGGSGAYEYSFDGGNTWTLNPTRTLLSAGIYDLRIRDRNQINCERVLNANFNLTQPATITAGYQKFDLTCYNENNGRIQFTNPQGGSGNYEYSIDGGTNWNTNSNFTGLPAGMYNLRIREFQNPNCVTIVNPNISVTQPQLLDANVNVTNVQGCDQLTNGEITFSNTRGGSGSYQFSVNGGNWFIGPTISNLSVGVYNVRIRDAAMPTCERILGTYTVFGPESIQASITDVPILCNGGSTTLQIINTTGGSGEYEYSIDGGASWYLSNTFNVRAGVYNVRVRDRNFRTCVATINGSYLVSQPQQLNAVINSTPVTGCYGNLNGSISITNPTGGSGLYRYSIDMGTTWVQNGNFINLTAGTYTVMIRDENNPFCQRILNANLQITQPDQLSASSYSTNVTGCYGNTNAQIVFLSPQGGSGLYRYSIDGGQNWQGSSTFSNLPAGNYSLWIGDQLSLACTTMINANLQITQPTQINANLTASGISCYGLTDGYINIANPTGGSGQYQYSIDGGGTWQNEGNYPNLLPGNYSAYIRDLNNPLCIRVLNGNINMTTPGQLTANLIAFNVTDCFGGNNGSINFTNPQGGSGQYEFSINGGVSWQLSQQFTGLSAGTYNAQIRDAVYPSCNRVIQASVTITQPNQINGSVSHTNVTGCGGNANASISFSNISGGSGQYQYSIDGGQTWSNSSSFNNLVAGSYDTRVRDAIYPTCIRVIGGSPIIITQPQGLSVTISSTNVNSCNGNPNGTISFTSPTGGSGQYQYSINGGQTWQNTATFSGLLTGTYSTRMRDLNNPSCVFIGQTIVITNTPNNLTGTIVSTTQASCSNSSTGAVDLSISGGTPAYTYLWSNGAITQDLYNVLPGTYIVTISDQTGCTAVISATVTAIQDSPGPDVVAIWNHASCGLNNGTITASAVINGRVPIPIFEYSIDGINWQLSNVFENVPAGNYTVRARVVGESCVGIFAATVLSNGGPSGVTISNVLNGSALVSWNAVNNNVGVRYNLRYRVQGSQTWIYINNLTTNSRSINGLQAGTTYEVQVQTVCPDGQPTQFTNSVTFTTVPNGGSCPTPTGVYVTITSPTSARVFWNTVPSAVCYIISYGRTGTNQAYWPTYTVNVPTTQFLMSGLLQGVGYQVMVRANCTNCEINSGTRSPWSLLIPYNTNNQRESGSIPTLADAENQLIRNYVIYPNPNEGNFTINMDSDESTTGMLYLTDVTGKMVYELQVSVQQGRNEFPVHLPDISSGVYLLRFTVGINYQNVTKIVIN